MNAETANPHGWGIAYRDNGRTVHRVRGFGTDELVAAYEKVKAYDLVIHCRIATSGNINELNNHPFTLKRGRAFLFHNGVFHDVKLTNARYSDTWHLAQQIKPIFSAYDRSGDPLADNSVWYQAINKWVTSTAYTNKVVIFTSDNTHIINEKVGVVRDGIWFSNTTAFYDPTVKWYATSTNPKDNTANTGYWKAWGGADDGDYGTAYGYTKRSQGERLDHEWESTRGRIIHPMRRGIIQPASVKPYDPPFKFGCKPSARPMNAAHHPALWEDGPCCDAHANEVAKFFSPIGVQKVSPDLPGVEFSPLAVASGVWDGIMAYADANDLPDSDLDNLRVLSDGSIRFPNGEIISQRALRVLCKPLESRDEAMKYRALRESDHCGRS